mgnify:CR=1 FL=1
MDELPKTCQSWRSLFCAATIPFASLAKGIDFWHVSLAWVGLGPGFRQTLRGRLAHRLCRPRRRLGNGHVCVCRIRQRIAGTCQRTACTWLGRSHFRGPSPQRPWRTVARNQCQAQCTWPWTAHQLLSNKKRRNNYRPQSRYCRLQCRRNISGVAWGSFGRLRRGERCTFVCMTRRQQTYCL